MGRWFDQVAPAQRVSRPLLPAPVKGRRSRHSGEGGAPGCGAGHRAGPRQCAGANRGDTKRVEAAKEGEHSGIPHLRSPAGAAADDRQIAGRRIGETVGRRQPGPPAASIGGRTRAAIETTPIVRATSIGSTPGHRARRRDGPVRHVCTFWVAVAAVRRAWHPSWPRTAKHRAGAAERPATVAAPKNPHGNMFRHRSPASTGSAPAPPERPGSALSPHARRAELRYSRRALRHRNIAPMPQPAPAASGTNHHADRRLPLCR